MAMSTAERQRRHRERNRYQKSMLRINLWLHGDAHDALVNLSRHHGKTHSALIGDFLLEAQQKILKAIPWGDEAWDRYWVTETKIRNRKVKVTMITDPDEDGEISGV
jgi:hypothetical protein